MLCIGSDQGESLPANEYASNEQFLKWSDTVIRQGWYLGVLATELELHRRSTAYSQAGAQFQITLAETENELKLAVNALERLQLPSTNLQDYRLFAEYFLPNKIEPMLDYQTENEYSFILRDDVNASIINKIPNVEKMESDFAPLIDVTSEAQLMKEESQDQVYHLLMGIAILKKFQGDSDFTKSAEKVAGNVMGWIARHNWEIKNPALSQNVSRGAYTEGMAYGAWYATKNLTGIELTRPSLPIWTLSEKIWENIAILGNAITDLLNLLKLKGSLQDQVRDALAMILALSVNGTNWDSRTYRVVLDLAELNGNNWHIYPLLWSILHEDSTHIDELYDKIRPMFMSLTEFQGNSPAAAAPEGWRAPLRFIATREEQDKLDGTRLALGSVFSGLDFMLLYNAMAIAKPDMIVV